MLWQLLSIKITSFYFQQNCKFFFFFINFELNKREKKYMHREILVRLKKNFNDLLCSENYNKIVSFVS